MDRLELIIELIFLFEILLSSITSYVDDNDKRITDLAKIRKYYFYNGFAMDFLAIIPFYPIFKF